MENCIVTTARSLFEESRETRPWVTPGWDKITGREQDTWIEHAQGARPKPAYHAVPEIRENWCIRRKIQGLPWNYAHPNKLPCKDWMITEGRKCGNMCHADFGHLLTAQKIKPNAEAHRKDAAGGLSGGAES